ncbi:MAG: CAP domain-containing protein [Verrucomicrobia bacterium]|nr:CAP domain-containing protein [Verrucomicrobiota bacterium]
MTALLFAGAGAFYPAHADITGADLDRAVLAEINFVRTSPQRYADLLAEQRGCYHDGNLRTVPGEGTVRTLEGVAALDGAIRALRDTRPMEPLSSCHGLALAAHDHARDQSERGGYGHHGSDGSSPFMRMNRHGRWVAHAGEAIDYGNVTARRIVMNLIIDDGVRDRGHRLNILDSGFAVAGVGCATHPQYHRLCVIDFANAYLEPGAAETTTLASNNRGSSSYNSGGGNNAPSLVSPMVSRATGLAPLPQYRRF